MSEQTKDWPTEPTGHCANCGASVAKTHIFCSGACWVAFRDRTMKQTRKGDSQDPKGSNQCACGLPRHPTKPFCGGYVCLTLTAGKPDMLSVNRSELDTLTQELADLDRRFIHVGGELTERIEALEADVTGHRASVWKRAANAEESAMAERISMDAECARLARRDHLREIAAQSLQTFLSMGLAPDLAAKQAYKAARELLSLIEWDERGGSGSR